MLFPVNSKATPRTNGSTSYSIDNLLKNNDKNSDEEVNENNQDFVKERIQNNGKETRFDKNNILLAKCLSEKQENFKEKRDEKNKEENKIS